MTANRKWVRIIARWIARIDGVSKHIRLAMLSLTGISTMSIGLRQYGYSNYTVPIIGIIGFLMLIYTYLYTEGGVWNQVGRDRQDLSNNYANPNMKISNEIIGMAVFTAVKGRKPTAKERELITETVDDTWQKYREGIDL